MRTKLTPLLLAVAVVGCTDSEAPNLPAEVLLDITMDNGSITWDPEATAALGAASANTPVRIRVKSGNGDILTDFRADNLSEASAMMRTQARIAAERMTLIREAEFKALSPEDQQALLNEMREQVKVAGARVLAMEKALQDGKDGGR